MIRIASAAVSTAAVLALAACATSHDGTAAAPGAPSDTAGQCDASQAQSVIGQQASEAVLAQARTAAGAGTVRALKPDDVVTMEYRDDRLNVMVDDAGIVTAVRCG